MPAGYAGASYGNTGSLGGLLSSVPFSLFQTTTLSLPLSYINILHAQRFSPSDQCDSN